MRNYLVKKILKDYVIEYSYGYDKYMNSKYFGKFTYIDKTDILKVYKGS